MNRSRISLYERFSRLSYSTKFTLITVVFLIPVLAFLPLVSDQLTTIDKYGFSEQTGTIYLRSLWSFSENVRMFVNTSRKYADGTIQLSVLQDAQSRTDASLDELSALQAEHGSSLNTADQWEQLQTQWLSLKISVQNAEWPEFELNQSALLESVDELTSLVGDTSNLILDPSLDTYYMMDTVLIKVPENQRLIFETYRIANQGLRAGSFTIEEQTLLVTTIGRLEANLDAMDHNISVAIQNDPTGRMQQVMSVPLEGYSASLRAFTDLVGTTLNDSAATGATPGTTLDAAYEEQQAASSKLYGAASKSLESGIQYRIQVLRQRLSWILTIAALSMLSAFLIGSSMMSSISQPLVDLIRATERLSQGDMSSRVAIDDTGEIGQVGIAFNQMAEDLEQDKAALISRTAELDTARNQSERRARDLQAISEISRVISSEQRLDVLLPLIARTVNDKLGFAYVGFFLLDDSRQFAVLQATSSDRERENLMQNYRLGVNDPGIISAAMASGKPQIASAMEHDKSSQDALFPEARSELALPVRLGAELIGILDIRSMHSKIFSFDNLAAFEVLASQVGIAIQNARLNEQNVQALKDIEDAYRRLAGSTWSSLARQMDLKAYGYDGVSSRALPEVPSQKSALLTVPVTVRGQVVGNLRLNPLDPNRTLTDDDIAIAQAVAERAALALEAARLLEDAQKRASRESFLSEMASKLSGSFQLDSILRDTVEELGQSLNGSTVSFQLVDPAALPKSEKSNGRKKGAA